MNDEMRRKSRRIASLALGVALFLIMAGGVIPQVTPAFADASTSVSIAIPDRVVPSSNFTATININNVVNFDAASYDISFDPAVLKLNNVASGSISEKTFSDFTWNEWSPGTVAIVQNLSGVKGVSGTGSLAVLQFYVKSSLSQATSLNFLANSKRVLGNTNAEEIPATWTGVLIQAVPPSPTLSANFSVSNFSVKPREVMPLESVTVSVDVTNSGGREGSYPVVLKVNSLQEAKEDIILGSSQLRTVSFSLAKSIAGTYTVDVNGKAGEFTVTAPLPPTTQTTVTTAGLTAVPPLQVDANGVVQTPSLVTTADMKVSLTIANGTKILDVKGNALSSLSATVVTGQPAPTGKTIVSAYDFGPNGATFAPPVTLTITYTTASLPVGANENELSIFYWDSTEWVALVSTVNTTTKTVTAQTGHFTQFALISSVPTPTTPTVPTTPSAGNEVSPPGTVLSPEAGTPTPSEVTPASPQPPPPAPAQSINWLLWCGIGGAIIVIGLFIYFQVVRRLY